MKTAMQQTTEDIQTLNTRHNVSIYSEIEDKKFNSLKECAEYFKYSVQYICDMMKGRKTNKFKLIRLN